MPNSISQKALLGSRMPLLATASKYRYLSSRTSPLQSTSTSTYTERVASSTTEALQSASATTSEKATMSQSSPLSILPLSIVVRSLAINTISSSPVSVPAIFIRPVILANYSIKATSCPIT